MSLASHATVRTDRAERFAKQLGSHLGRRLEVRQEEAGTRIVFEGGSCLLCPSAEALELTSVATDADTLRRVEQVVGRHLEKFGARAGLSVQWVAQPGA